MTQNANSSSALIPRMFGQAGRRPAGTSRLSLTMWTRGRGSRPGRYFTTAHTSKCELQSRTLQALQSEGYAGRGEATVLSDGAEIMKRLPKVLPQPTTHIIDWFHIAMKIQPLQQIADHIVRWRDAGNSEMAHVDAEVRSLKWKLWHGQTDRALDQLETMTSEFAKLRERGDLSPTRLLHLAYPLLTYVRSNRSAIINYGARYGSGRRIATVLAESGVNSLVARRMVKKQQMQRSKRGAHLASGSGRRSQRRSSGAPHVQAAETSPSIKDRVAIRANTAAAQDGLTPRLIYRSPCSAFPYTRDCHWRPDFH